jgi:hypothetical protein
VLGTCRTENVSELRVAWTYHHVDFARPEFGDRWVHPLRCAGQITEAEAEAEGRPQHRPGQVPPISVASRLR